MNDPKDTAQAVGAVIGSLLGYICGTSLQAWALLVVFSWFAVPVSLTFFQAFVVCALVSSFF